MINKFGNAEMQYIPTEEINTDEVHTPHTWFCCWGRTTLDVLMILAIIGAVLVIVRMALIIGGQLDAALL